MMSSTWTALVTGELTSPALPAAVHQDHRLRRRRGVQLRRLRLEPKPHTRLMFGHPTVPQQARPPGRAPLRSALRASRPGCVAAARPSRDIAFESGV
jgi:hypothetical protein